MKPLIIIGTSLALVAVLAFCLRWWFRRLPDALAVQHRLCGILMWTGVLITVAAVVISFAASTPVTGLLLASTGLLTVTSTTLKRKQLARLLDERNKGAAV